MVVVVVVAIVVVTTAIMLKMIPNNTPTMIHRTVMEETAMTMSRVTP